MVAVLFACRSLARASPAMVGATSPPLWGWIFSAVFWLATTAFVYSLLQQQNPKLSEDYFLVWLSGVYLWMYHNMATIGGALFAGLGILNAYGTSKSSNNESEHGLRL